MMRKCDLAESYQRKFLGENVRKLYHIETPKTFIRERVTEIERPDWWPTAEEIERALKPEAALLRPYRERGRPATGPNGTSRAKGRDRAKGAGHEGART
jgi:hypothetical protein